MEGHLGDDGKYYLLDFARMFPPEGKTSVFVFFLREYTNDHIVAILIAPLKETHTDGRTKRCVYYQMLRPGNIHSLSYIR